MRLSRQSSTGRSMLEIMEPEYREVWVSSTTNAPSGWPISPVNAETKVAQMPPAPADGAAAKDDGGKRLKPSAGTIADIATGDVVRISGAKNGDTVTAQRIVEGAGGGPGLGLGRGHGHGRGPK